MHMYYRIRCLLAYLLLASSHSLSNLEGTGAVWPDHIVDVKTAICWVKDNIAQYGGNPNMIVIAGGSAGGHLAALAALTPHHAEFQPGFEQRDTSVQVNLQW